jgi:hypothetical protein
LAKVWTESEGTNTAILRAMCGILLPKRVSGRITAKGKAA